MYVENVRISRGYTFALVCHIHVHVYQAFLIPEDMSTHDLKSVLEQSLPINCSLAQRIFSEYFIQPEIYGIEKFFLCD